MDDGVALKSTAHPRSAWYQHLWFHLWTRWRAPRLDPASLETIEIEIPVMQAGMLHRNILGSVNINPFRINMSDNEIEQQIQDKVLAPRVRLEQIEDVISEEYFFTADKALVGTPGEASQSCKLLTFCVLVLKNGFTVTGESACAHPDNFDVEIGRKVARQKAINKIWMLEGYLLKERLHSNDINRTSGMSGDFGDS